MALVTGNFGLDVGTDLLGLRELDICDQEVLLFLFDNLLKKKKEKEEEEEEEEEEEKVKCVFNIFLLFLFPSPAFGPTAPFL